jgi:hypothetical protein
MHTLLLSVALLGQGQAPPANRDANPAARPGAPAAAGMPQVNGTWKVVAMEVDGHSGPSSPAVTVTIRDNVLHINAGGQGSEPGRGDSERPNPGRPGAAPGAGSAGGVMSHSWRLEFGPNNTVRAFPVAGDGTNERPGGATQRPGAGAPGSPPAGAPAAAPGGVPGGAPAAAPGGAAARPAGAGFAPVASSGAGMHTGVFIATHDYLCLSFNTGASGPGAPGNFPGAPGRPQTAPGTAPGGAPAAGNPPGAPGAPGRPQNPGAAPGSAPPPGGNAPATPVVPGRPQPAGGPGAGNWGGAGHHGSFVVILHRQGAGSGPEKKDH